MSNYNFETSKFGLSDNGLHLLRSGYNYKTLAYHDIRKATLKRGVAIKNWLLVLLLGISLISFAVYQAAHLYHLFMDPATHTVYIQTVVLPVLSLILGNYCIYISLKRTTILKIKYRGGKTKLSLKTIVINNETEQLVAYLQEKLGTRFAIEAQEAVGQFSTNIS